jgi:hypothetical protein
MGKLLNIDANAKTVKGQAKGYMTGILYLAPAKLSGFEVCPMRSAGCSAACLNTAGRGAFSNVQKARIRKTKEYFADKQAFITRINKEILALKKKALKNGFEPCVRLNGTSDLDWTAVVNQNPDIQFYDYSKVHTRVIQYLQGKLPKNYYLTFSLNEANMDKALEILNLGGNVAMVFDTKKGQPLPKKHLGFEVVDGDLSDLRFLDKKGVIVGLRAKGKARKDASGFVQQCQSLKLAA